MGSGLRLFSYKTQVEPNSRESQHTLVGTGTALSFYHVSHAEVAHQADSVTIMNSVLVSSGSSF